MTRLHILTRSHFCSVVPRAAPPALARAVSLSRAQAAAPKQPCSASLGGAHAVGAASEAASLFTPVVANGNGSATVDASIAPWQRKTKVVCTIGPATADRENLFKLADEGMNVARCVLRAVPAVPAAWHPQPAPAATAGGAAVPVAALPLLARCSRRAARRPRTHAHTPRGARRGARMPPGRGRWAPSPDFKMAAPQTLGGPCGNENAEHAHAACPACPARAA
jgi:hypothetical protein